MRLTPIALTVAIIAGTMASSGLSQRPDDQIDPRSTAMVEEAKRLSQGGEHDRAIDLLESALVLDPRNRGAYVALGRVAQAQRLPGKAIGHYADALRLEPNDANALAAQGEAYVQRGAVDRARGNLERLRRVCASPCSQADELAAVIQRGPPPEVLAAQRPEQGSPTETPRRN